MSDLYSGKISLENHGALPLFYGELNKVVCIGDGRSEVGYAD